MSVAQKLGVTDEQIHELSKPESRSKCAKIAEAMVKAITELAHKVLWTVMSDGRDANALITAIEAKDRKVSDRAKDIMYKPQFKTSSGKTYRLAIIKGDEFADDERTTTDIFAEAERRGLQRPPAEVAALLREKYSQDELGFPYVAVMHEPICDSDGDPFVLALYCGGAAAWLLAVRAYPGSRWRREGVFVFLARQD